jgi:hypothetical protein
MKLVNSTALNTERLATMLVEQADGWSHRSLTVHVRYSRGRDFSGLCSYASQYIRINIGRHVRFPYDVQTYLARAKSNARMWWREIYRLRVADAHQLILFVFLHEFYHWLVRQARRNTRQKESMCDRFAARVLVDRYGATVHDRRGRPVPREEWDFQDLERFVARARRLKRGDLAAARAARVAMPVGTRIPTYPDGHGETPTGVQGPGEQLLLFPDDE